MQLLTTHNHQCIQRVSIKIQNWSWITNSSIYTWTCIKSALINAGVFRSYLNLWKLNLKRYWFTVTKHMLYKHLYQHKKVHRYERDPGYLDERGHQSQKGNGHCILSSWLLDQHQQVTVVTCLHAFRTVRPRKERKDLAIQQLLH